MKLNKKSGLLVGLFTVALLAGCTETTSVGNSNNSSNSTSGTNVSTNSSTGGSGSADTYTYKTYTTISPSNWNELTYQDANDTQIMSYITGSFFTYDFEFDANGEIVPGSYVTTYSGAKKLEDVTSDFAGTYGVPEGKTSAYAYKITLRDDLVWEDGTPIHADDFVYSMREQLNPLFLNYRADSYYNGSVVIHNAKNYVFQGSTKDVTARDKYSTWDSVDQAEVRFSLYKESGVGSYLHKYYGDYIDAGWTEAKLVYALGCASTEAEILTLQDKTYKEISEDETLSAIWANVIAWWKTEAEEELDFFVYSYTFPAVADEDLGILVGDNENELIIVLDNPLYLLKDDGSLSYTAAYYMSGLPLVKEDLYEKCKVEPTVEGGLWTTVYNTSQETTASWGPYKLTEFQSQKSHKLEKNEKWYGYNMEEYAGQYQTTAIETEVYNYDTALLAFLQGDLTGIGVSSSVASTYKNSSRALFTADDYVASMQLQSSKEALVARNVEEGENHTLLSYVDFRNAISLAVDRADFVQACTTASLPGFGLFNTMHYYDVENGGAYRYTDAAKKVLCEIYGVNPDDYRDLDAAVDAITGYDIDAAKGLVEKAYQAALEAGDITETDNVYLTFGTGSSDESTMRIYNYLADVFSDMVEGTSLEGRIVTEFEDHGNSWSNDFRDGKYDICLGGWSGAAWDPGYLLMAYIDAENYAYSAAWDTTTHMMTFTMPEGDYEGAGEELTMDLMSWWYCLNGVSGADYNWASGAIDEEYRLELIARMEKEVLLQYYTVPLYNYFSCSLLSYQVEYITTEYNTFMGYGGIRYMTYNYSDAEWAEYCANNTLDYTI